MHQALTWASKRSMINDKLRLTKVAAISGGLLDNRWLLDLCAEEAAAAEFIVTMVFDESKQLVDLKATRETGSMDISELSSLLNVAAEQSEAIFRAQALAIAG
jgi:ribonuclease PH